MSQTLSAYRVPPQCEFKAAQELDRSGYQYELPAETLERRSQGKKPSVRNVPLMRGYLPANGKPSDAKYVGRSIGAVDRVEIIRMVSTLDRIQNKQLSAVVPFSIGQAAMLGEVPGVIAGVRGETCTFAYDLLGKTHSKTIHYGQLRPG